MTAGAKDTQKETLAFHFTRGYRLCVFSLTFSLLVIVISATAVIIVGLPAAIKAADAQRSAQSSLTAALDEQTAFRAAIVTGDNNYVQQFHQDQGVFAISISRLNNLVASNRMLSSEIISARVHHDEWENFTQTNLNQLPAANASPMINTGTPLFQQYRNDADQLISLTSSNRLAKVHLLFLAAGTPIVVLIAIFTTSLFLLKREQTTFTALVLEPIEAIEDAARRVAEGDLEVALLPGGAGDFQQLSENINAMTQSLVEERERTKSHIESVTEEQVHLHDLLDFTREATTQTRLRDLQQFLCRESMRMTKAESVILLERTDSENLVVTSSAGNVDLSIIENDVIDRTAKPEKPPY